jgi:hypothetical protein
LVEELKNIGFQYATKGISGIEDLKFRRKKYSLIMDASNSVQLNNKTITGVERFQRLIDTGVLNK